MTTGNIAFLAIAVAGFGSFMVGLLYASFRTAGGAKD